MCQDKTKPFKFKPLFVPPKRSKSSDGKDEYIFYKVLDTITNQYIRRKVMLNKFPKGYARDLAAADIMSRIFNSFQRNELPDDLSVKRSVPVSKLLESYKRFVKTMGKKDMMRPKTVTDYCSRIKILKEYLEDRSQSSLEIGRVDSSFFVDFLDYVFLDRINSPTTRNNYRTWCSAFCGWLVERKYLLENPIADIPVLPEKKKFREALAPEDMKKLQEHLVHTDKRYLLACMFEYYEMIRPTELVQLRIKDVSLKDLTLFVPSAISKNRKDGLIALNEHVAKLLVELNVLNAPGSFFIFGRDFMPSDERASSAIFRLRFSDLRDVLHFPLTYQFYSLKDTGIRDLINSCGAVTAKEQARHSSIEVTNRYVVGRDGYVGEATKHFKGFL